MHLPISREPFDIKSIDEFTVDAILDLPDVAPLLRINKDQLSSDEDRQKFAEFVALWAKQHAEPGHVQ